MPGVVPGTCRIRKKHLGTRTGLLPGDLLARFVLGTYIPGMTRRNFLPVYHWVFSPRGFLTPRKHRSRVVTSRECAAVSRRRTKKLCSLPWHSRGVLFYASEELDANKEVVLTAVAQNGCPLNHGAAELFYKEVVLTDVAHDYYALMYASVELTADKEVLFAAVAQKRSRIAGDIYGQAWVLTCAAARNTAL